jgi:hypothetical protein
VSLVQGDAIVSPSSARARFALDHVRNVLGYAVTAEEAGSELLDAVFRELSRTTEVETSVRDTWGNWDFPYGASNRSGELFTPWLDRRIQAVGATLAARAPGRKSEPAWPDGRRFAVVLSHDVDYVTLQPTVTQSLRWIRRDAGLLFARGHGADATSAAMRSVARHAYLVLTGRGFRRRPERAYDAWLELEGGHGFRSTFFYSPERVSAPHPYDCLYSYDDMTNYGGRRNSVRAMMVEMANAGWEIGLHGSFHSARRPGLLAEQKLQVEQAAGRPVNSTRQHWLHYDVRVTPGLQAGSGFLVDSTQGFNRSIGFRSGTAFPYPCWDFTADAPLPLLEVPQHIMDGSLFTANALAYDVDLAVQHSLEIMDSVERVGGCLVLNWHPNGIEYPAYWTVYGALLAEAARRGAWGCSMEQVREWWTTRTRRIAASAGEAPGTSPR